MPNLAPDVRVSNTRRSHAPPPLLARAFDLSRGAITRRDATPPKASHHRHSVAVPHCHPTHDLASPPPTWCFAAAGTLTSLIPCLKPLHIHGTSVRFPQLGCFVSRRSLLELRFGRVFAKWVPSVSCSACFCCVLFIWSRWSLVCQLPVCRREWSLVFFSSVSGRMRNSQIFTFSSFCNGGVGRSTSILLFSWLLLLVSFLCSRVALVYVTNVVFSGFSYQLLRVCKSILPVCFDESRFLLTHIIKSSFLPYLSDSRSSRLHISEEI